MGRLLKAGLLVSIAVAAASCSAGTVADHVPVWAGGEPEGVPPRPGSPGYEEYRKKLTQPPAPPANNAQGSGAPAAPAAPAAAASGQQKN
jgi:hypothetical protein